MAHASEYEKAQWVKLLQNMAYWVASDQMKLSNIQVDTLKGTIDVACTSAPNSDPVDVSLATVSKIIRGQELAETKKKGG
jgi:hypothetical protein